MMKYTAKMDRNLLRRRHVISDPVTKKSGGVLVDNFKLRWNTVWRKDRVGKEAGLLWLIWHRAPAVNEWRARINRNLVTNCSVCGSGAKETVLHRFWECPAAQVAWKWGTHILNLMVTDPDSRGPWRPMNWKQGIFSDRTPRRFRRVQKVWMAIRATVVWLLWM
jgi:hypothetical protein